MFEKGKTNLDKVKKCCVLFADLYEELDIQITYDLSLTYSNPYDYNRSVKWSVLEQSLPK